MKGSEEKEEEEKGEEETPYSMELPQRELRQLKKMYMLAGLVQKLWPPKVCYCH
jgi:hypothetical protein